MQLQLRTLLVLSILIFLLSACTTPKPAPTLNLQYAPPILPANNKGISIALVQPRFTGVLAGLDNQDEEPGPVDSITLKYSTDYSPRLQQTMLADIKKIFSMHGYTVLLTVDSVDQIMPMEKQKIDLIAALLFTLTPQVENNQTRYHYPTGTRVANVGTVRFTGVVTLEFKEPISGEIVLTKKIDVAALKSNSLEEYEDQTEAEDKCLELLNSIYPDLMDQVEKNIKEINVTDLRAHVIKGQGVQEKKP